jgi:hypothetical protein
VVVSVSTKFPQSCLAIGRLWAARSASTNPSWLNQVEIWFGIFTRKALSGASFRSAEQLKQAIQDFTAAYNQRAAPFVWRKREVKSSQLRYTIVNLRN